MKRFIINELKSNKKKVITNTKTKQSNQWVVSTAAAMALSKTMITKENKMKILSLPKKKKRQNMLMTCPLILKITLNKMTWSISKYKINLLLKS